MRYLPDTDLIEHIREENEFTEQIGVTALTWRRRFARRVVGAFSFPGILSL
jgi:hypothetical protein